MAIIDIQKEMSGVKMRRIFTLMITRIPQGEKGGVFNKIDNTSRKK